MDTLVGLSDDLGKLDGFVERYAYTYTKIHVHLKQTCIMNSTLSPPQGRLMELKRARGSKEV